MEALQPSRLLLPYVASAVLTAGLTIYGIQRVRADRTDRTIVTFVAIVAMVTVWSVARIGEFLFVAESITRFWLAVLYVGLGGSSMSVLFFALAYTGRERLLTRRNVALILVVPAVAVLLAGTNQYHTLFWSGEFETIDGHSIFVREFNTLFFVYLLYIQGIFVVAAYLLLRMAMTSPEVYRRQTLAFLLGSGTPIVVGTLFALDAVPGLPTYVDPTPLAFAFAGLCFAYAIFRHHMLDLIPIARDTVIESMRDGYVVLDTKDRVVDRNDAARELWDSPSESVGDDIHTVLPELTPVLDEHEHGTRTENELTVEIDGETRFLLATVSSLTHIETTIGHLVLLRDITERRAVQRRYRTLIENSSDIIFVVQADGTITYVSPSIRNILGLDPEPLVGGSCFDLVLEEDREALKEGFAEILDDPEATTREEYRTRDGDGNVRVLEAIGRNMLEDPFVHGIVINARDVTARRERERELAETNEQLAEANERLEAANDRLEEFASVISHDLRNPLNVAKGRLELAREHGDDEHLENVADSLDRMEAIVEDVLTLARQGEGVSDLERVELAQLAREAWTHVDTEDATLVVAENGRFEADSSRLLQLLENLFRNAREHVGDDVTVTVGVEDGLLYVEDDGRGIPPEKRDDVFESGFTTNEDGTGFGLSIVTQIASAHGWEVSVTEGSSGGARFEFHGLERNQGSG